MSTTTTSTDINLDTEVAELADWIVAVAHGRVAVSDSGEPTYVGDMGPAEDTETYTLLDWVNDQLGFVPTAAFVLPARKWDPVGVVIHVAYGGPNIWVDTQLGSEGIHAAWGPHRAFAPLPHCVLDELDELAMLVVGED